MKITTLKWNNGNKDDIYTVVNIHDDIQSAEFLFANPVRGWPEMGGGHKIRIDKYLMF